ncbi:MAG: tRNA dihydrouridine synthase DusB [Deltaproteobacteria bacterium]|nr:tRNA dihydrouridine synthase DusB [Deltaproteobacteria bacterium]MBW1962252.1 tRNA dihydrouridine synthase DusB [Deltaproteobacteria bacterium]MBW1992949.1 tRNA dihydrouridine synthase DusB [Deltaproteobacteria bacterium]MBW2150984.1 tRNA dihydrouridine synthase DusB [Deltaproteobacteria bacterium]
MDSGPCLKIGPVLIPAKTIQAPLAGITNLPFRLLAKSAGCGLVYSEMISSNALAYGSRKTLQMLAGIPEEKPVVVQIFGADPAIMAEAAAIVESSGADIVDINMGCPVRKVVRTGAGVALMRTFKTAEAVIKAVRRSVKIPVTIKIRSGWNASGRQALGIATIAESCGVDAIAVHPRTAMQGFKGKADWSLIARIKEQVLIPVIGNGDIVSAADAEAMMKQTACDAVMVGRAAIGNPWIFEQINHLLCGKPVPSVDLTRRFRGMKTYLRMSVNYLGEAQACRMMRSRLGWYAKGLPYSSRFRESINQLRTEEEALEIIDKYQAFLHKKLVI